MSLCVWFEHFLDFWAEILTIFSLHFWKILDTEISFWNWLHSEINWPLASKMGQIKKIKAHYHGKTSQFPSEIIWPLAWIVLKANQINAHVHTMKMHSYMDHNTNIAWKTYNNYWNEYIKRYQKYINIKHFFLISLNLDLMVIFEHNSSKDQNFNHPNYEGAIMLKVSKFQNEVMKSSLQTKNCKDFCPVSKDLFIKIRTRTVVTLLML